MKRSLAALAGRPGRPAVLAGALAWLPLSAAAVEIVAHRGASYDAPENTLPAVELGWQQGADAVEVDIHQTSDGKVVAIHDSDTRRVTGKPGVVAEMRLDQLLLLDAGAWKAAQWSGTRIPTLEQVLETVPPGKTLVVEIKCSRDVLPELERVLDASGKRQQVMLIAFDYETISEAKQTMPDRPCYWLSPGQHSILCTSEGLKKSESARPRFVLCSRCSTNNFAFSPLSSISTRDRERKNVKKSLSPGDIFETSHFEVLTKQVFSFVK